MDVVWRILRSLLAWGEACRHRVMSVDEDVGSLGLAERGGRGLTAAWALLLLVLSAGRLALPLPPPCLLLQEALLLLLPSISCPLLSFLQTGPACLAVSIDILHCEPGCFRPEPALAGRGDGF